MFRRVSISFFLGFDDNFSKLSNFLLQNSI